MFAETSTAKQGFISLNKTFTSILDLVTSSSA
jgi:hypothetical protein